jgi:hypothetical protein
MVSRISAMMGGCFELPGRTAFLAASCLLSAAALRAQAGETERTFCDGHVPGGFPCSEDIFAVAFEPGGEPVVELADFEPGLRVETRVVLDARNQGIQGWALGVAHDPEILSIESATFEGTDAARLFRDGFQVTDIARETVCDAGGCQQTIPRRGFISATVLSLTDGLALPVGRHSVARAEYLLLPKAAEFREAGLLIEFRNGLMGRGQPVDVVITANGETKRPRTVVDGLIRLVPEAKEFHRGDPNADGRVAIGDAVGLVLFLFLLGPSPACLEAADADDTGRLDTTDPILILQWLFLGGTAPAPPGPPPAPCGPDPQGGGLGCDAYEAC